MITDQLPFSEFCSRSVTDLYGGTGLEGDTGQTAKAMLPE